jgi:hypothetical protein
MDLYNENKLRDSHIAELDKWRKEHPNDEMSTKIGALADEFRDKTVEAKARGASKKQKAWDLYTELSNLGNRELVQSVRSLSKEERNLLETYHPDILSLTR